MINLIETICDKSFDIFIICIAFSLSICLVIFTCNLSNDYEEEKCVEFYKKNKYITKSCEIYTDKLVNSNE